MNKLFLVLAALMAFSWPSAALADVTVTFQSFNGSVLFGRYPHAFVVLEGELDNGTKIDENFGFTAATVSPAILSGPVKHKISVEPDKYVNSTNKHFSVTVNDAQYARIKRELVKWRDAPGKYYELDSRNCIHFVGSIAQIAGLKVSYPKKLVRKPKAWLNHISALNPKLRAGRIK